MNRLFSYHSSQNIDDEPISINLVIQYLDIKLYLKFDGRCFDFYISSHDIYIPELDLIYKHQFGNYIIMKGYVFKDIADHNFVIKYCNLTGYDLCEIGTSDKIF